MTFQLNFSRDNLRRRTSLLGRSVLLGLGAMVLMGADADGCSAEYQSGDGRDENWSFGEIPVPTGEDKPMSCEWLESNNCWKEFSQKVQDCAPTDQGSFDQERATCSFDEGHQLQLAGPISEPSDGTTHFPIVNHRIVDADGEPCLTAKILDAGHHAFDVQGEVYVTESLSLTEYRVVCPDGSSFSNAVEGSCNDFGWRWLVRRTPGYTLTCEGSNDTCEASIWGSNADGEAIVAECNDPFSRDNRAMGGDGGND